MRPAIAWGIETVRLRMQGYAFQMEIVVRARKLGFTIAEVRLRCIRAQVYPCVDRRLMGVIIARVIQSMMRDCGIECYIIDPVVTACRP